jgi:hypothetical protein
MTSWVTRIDKIPAILPWQRGLRGFYIDYHSATGLSNDKNVTCHEEGFPKYSVAEMSVQISFRHTGMLLAGIQEAFVDSGQEIAGMTIRGNLY